MSYRIYIDETGTCSMSCPSDENNRYLSLTGVIINESYARTTMSNDINDLKRKYFKDGTKVILHRKEIINKTGHFSVFKNPTIESEFSEDLLSILSKLDYTIVTAIIDKKEHLDKYIVWQAEPYHYCMEVIIERYHWFLTNKNTTGDVMIESRSKLQDKKLKKAYKYYYYHGTKYKKSAELQARLTSNDIKFKPKSANILGLQLADLIAHPVSVCAKAQRMKKKMPDSFGRKIAIIQHKEKFYRSTGGKIDGYGLKWLPE